MYMLRKPELYQQLQAVVDKALKDKEVRSVLRLLQNFG